MKSFFQSLIALFKKPFFNFALVITSVLICVLPKIFDFKDSFNRPGVNDIFDKESMKTCALLLLLSASPTVLDFLLDILFGHHNLDKNHDLKRASFLTSISYIIVSLDILAKLGYFAVDIIPTHLHLSFEFLVWFVRLSSTASLMFSLSTLNPELFPTWKTSIVTLTVASYGLLRYVVPYEGSLDYTFYYVLFSIRICLIMCVHYMFCDWLYKLFTHRKWTLKDYGVLFYLTVFALLTLNFISNSISNVFYKSAYVALINLDHLRVQQTIIDLVIANVMLAVIPSRLAKIELIEYKVIIYILLLHIFLFN